MGGQLPGRWAEIDRFEARPADDVVAPHALDELGGGHAELVAQRLEGVGREPAVVGAPVGAVDVAAEGVGLLDGVEPGGTVRREEVRHAGGSAH